MNKNLNETLADAVMNRPREFFIDSKRFCLWSPSLGMSLMLGRHFESLEIDYRMLGMNPTIEALRLVTQKKSEVCHILSILSFCRFEELSESRKIEERARVFEETLTLEETAQLLLFALSQPKIETLFEQSGIAKEREEQARISAYKNKDGHTRSFGGKTIFGSLVDSACRAYGWTKDYVVWGIDLISLRMMLADSVNSLYLSDEEAKALFILTEKDEAFGMTEADFAKLRAMDWD